MNHLKTSDFLKIVVLLAAVAVRSENRLFAGTLFVAASGGAYSNVFCGISSNGIVTPINIDQSAFAAYGNQEGMAVDTNGNLYVAYSGDAVVKFTTNTAILFASSIGAPSLLSFDSAGNLYGNSNNCIIRITTNGTSVYASGIPGMNAFCFDYLNNLYVSTESEIFEITPGGSTNAFATPASVNSGALPPDRLYFATIGIGGQSNLFALLAIAGAAPDCYVFGVNTNGVGNEVLSIGNDFLNQVAFVVDENNNFAYTDSMSDYFFEVFGPQIVGPHGASFNIYPNINNSMAYTPVDEVLGIYAPSVFLQPISQTVAAGSTITLKSSFVGSLPITYQWYFDQTNLIVGATNITLTLTNVTENESGQYTMVASNYLGTASSQPGELDILPSLGIVLVPTVVLYGGVGFSYDVEYINQFGPTNSPWTTLATVTLTNSPQYYPDFSALGQPARFYRIVQTQ